MVKFFITLFLTANSIFTMDSINEVPTRYADFLGGRVTLLRDTFSFQIHVERLYQNYSGPIYMFIDADGDTSTGWSNTGYISEDEFPLSGADLLLLFDKFNPAHSTLYSLQSDGSMTPLSYIPCGRILTTTTRTKIYGKVGGIKGRSIHLQLFINEEGNWGDLFPNRGTIILHDSKENH